jgi:dipeptidase
MKKALLFLMLLLVVASAALGAVAASAFANPVSATDHCNFLVAGKNATADHSVLVEYNNDWAPNNYTYLQVVPATSSTYRYVRVLTKGDCAEGGINDHQLTMVYGVATSLDRAVTTADPYVVKGYGNEIWDIVLQQCSTASQAIDMLGQMAATRGFSVAAAGSLCVADPNGAWVFELLGGHHWVAARVPDDCYYEQPNMLRIRQVNLSDPANFRGSPDLVQFAIDIGRYNPSDGPFDVAWAYGDRADLQNPYDTNRLWIVLHRFTPSLNADVAMPYATRPVFVRPDRPLTRQDFMAIDREHYEGTVLDQTLGYTLMTPHDMTDRPICYSTTDYGTVYQLRSWLPDDVGGVLWLALSRPCSSVFVPFYAGTTSVPAAWAAKPPTSAYSSFRAVADSLDRNAFVGGISRYGYYIPLVRGAYGGLEGEMAAAQPAVESNAACLWKRRSPEQARAYLTNYTAERAAEALDLSASLLSQMP